ncbi:cytochrome P450 family protein [Actinoalloteichus caeruleus]|uniref:Cytochrome P450 n=1 Tax=Actinoalloteichus caeruleus DSM 43889 TaxID=1120930 RepID=A0ABT1JCL8_ACTCY|nr:cytochrome P450 [Actinoalloteichus caeruleus]MCP2329926.1 Cytochrome P450 [Actinoalloteichus caeruleus DSM 43889]
MAAAREHHPEVPKPGQGADGPAERPIGAGCPSAAARRAPDQPPTGDEDGPDLFQDEWFRDPHPTYARLRAECPVRQVRSPGGHEAWIVLGYAEAREALADGRISKDVRAAGHIFARSGRRRDLAPAVSQTMLATDPPDHTRLRGLARAAFTPAAVHRLRPRIRAIAEGLAESMAAEAGPVDLVERFALPLPVTVICELLAVPEADRAALGAWSSRLFLAGQPEVIDEASHQLADYLSELVERRRRQPGDDLLSELIAARDAGDRLSEGELVSLAALLLIAGHETTTNLLGTAVLSLLTHPEQLAWLRADLARLPAAVEELLRHDGPVNVATFRFTTEPVRLAGVDLPADAVVMVSLGAADRDPSRFPEPDRLDLRRRSAGHLAFGHGIHYCLGAPLARAEAEIGLGVLLRRFPGLRLAGPPEEVGWRRSRLMRGPESLFVLTRAEAGTAP